MSERFPGGVITKSPATPTGPFQTGAAPGIWTLDQQLQYQQQGVWPTAGLSPNYIEDVFSAFLYDGNSSTQTITNGIDLSTKGGLVWGKRRNSTGNHFLVDTVRGSDKVLISDLSIYGSLTSSVTVTGFNSTGFGIGAGDILDCNNSGGTYVSWTFREQPKFFDVVTWSGSGINTTIPHSLGSVPGSIIVKRTDTAAAWAVYHRSLANTQYLVLNTTAAAATGATRWNSTTPTSAVFSVGTDATVNASGGTYVAYVFAHDAGGFGLTGTDNVISCGSFTTATATLAVTLGYEPQYVLFKRTDDAGDWQCYDIMRGMITGGSQRLYPNLSNAEDQGAGIVPTSTGFSVNTTYNATFIYIAIRRGPMKVPTDATKVFEPITWTGNSTKRDITGTSFPPDMAFIRDRSAATGYSFVVQDKLRGPGNELQTWNTQSEFTGLATNPTGCLLTFNENGVTLGTDAPNHGYNVSSNPEIGEFFGRAPSFFDEVCYTGTGTYSAINHNLTIAPTLTIEKRRNGTGSWYVALYPSNKYGILESAAAFSNLGNTLPTATQFTPVIDTSAETYVAYLFATCAGVSKVGSYTGNGTTQTIDCGFTGGARFVLIKRTDATGGWYTYDTARGMTVLTDPYLLLNSTAAEVATLGSVTTVSTGFALNSTILAAINVSSGNYLFLAIA